MNKIKNVQKNQKMLTTCICLILLSFFYEKSTTVITNYLLPFIHILTIYLTNQSLAMLTSYKTLITYDLFAVLTFIKSILNLSASVTN